MIIQRRSESEIRPDQVRAMARGLYFLAELDGITEAEKELIRSFLAEGKVDVELDVLAGVPFFLDELMYGLDTVFLRKTFLRTCILLCQADGVISDKEMAELRRIAQVMAVDEPLDTLIESVQGKSL